MSRSRWLALVVLGMLTAGSMAAFVRVPGYMDGEYYYATAIELSEGRGFQEPFLWNYLDDPASLPHPSHLYWMPAVSVIAAAGLKLLGAGFRSAQLPFVILAAGLPALTAWISLQLKASTRQAFLSGLLAAFPAFYLPFLVTTDAFAALAWIGTLAFACGAAAHRTQAWQLWLAAGVAAGAAQLTRADGILLLIALALLAVLAPRRRLMGIGSLVFGFALVLVPWLARNLAISGTLFASGGARSLWLTSYDELFSYPPSLLEPGRWLSQGWSAILASRMGALGSNLSTLIVVVGSIVLGPFMLAGAWQKRRHPLLAGVAAYLLLLLAVMTLAFPFSGPRGGLFHSAAGVLPSLWALTPIGLASVLEWVSPRRGWNPERAWRLFAPTLLVLVIGLSIWVAWDRVVAGWPSARRWESSDAQQQVVTDALFRLDPSPGIVAVNDPPGFHLASGVPCVVVPYGDVSTLRAVADRFNLEWVILDANYPAPLATLYQDPDLAPWLELKGQVNDAQGRPIYLLHVTSRVENGTP
jgi:4-amino-4-deoxy-L-arabinose transferase-like glycosyltransferase